MKHEAYISSFLDSLPDHGFFTLDSSGLIQTWSSGSERLLGYSQKELVGKSFSCLLSGPRPDQLATNVLHIASTHGRFEDTSLYQPKNGNPVWMEVTIC